MKEMRAKNMKGDERGAALLEFAIGAMIFVTAMFGVLEIGRMLWVHNSLVDATRRAARYAVNQGMSTGAQTGAKNMAVYGNAAGAGQPLVPDLSASQVKITYQNFQLGGGTVTAEIENYDFNFVLPLVSKTITLPAYKTSLTAENAGYVPNVIP
ncbi:MAG TPA: TadE/TadG family type IV pilus assembly protein [Pyrinomonadaceae bacterium]